MTAQREARASLWNRRFGSLFWTQFLGAFNDHLFKNALVILVTFGAASHAKMASEQLVAISGALFVAPFFILSALAGQLADKFSKTALIRAVKLTEIGIMALGSIGFLTGNVPVLLGALFLTGVQAALFGPLKYGVLPELLGPSELVRGNALVEMGTFIAILLGTLAGGLLVALPGIGHIAVGAATVVTAVLGWALARRMPETSPSEPSLRVDPRVVRSTRRLLKMAREPQSILHSILGISWFWMLGAVVLSVLPSLVTRYLAGNEGVVTYLLALFSIGVAAGSLLCERLSRQKLELGLVPLGSLGITLFLLDAAFALGTPQAQRAPVSVTMLLGTFRGVHLSAALGLFAVSSGLFIVPLYTLLQERSTPGQRARVVAANNVANAAFMVMGSLLLVGAFALGASIRQILVGLACLNLCVAIYIYTVIPEFLFRFVCFVLAHVLYRLRIEGRDRIPRTGPAVLVCNHVTFIDWLIISAASQRPMRFVMHHAFLKLPFSGRFFKDAKVIPIAGAKEDPRLLEAAFTRISRELEQGEIVCVFPEGKLTRDGKISAFRPGVERILAETPVPVIPMHLSGLWQSIFSRYARRRPFERRRSKVRLMIGEPLSPRGISAQALEQRVRALSRSSLESIPRFAPPERASEARRSSPLEL